MLLFGPISILVPLKYFAQIPRGILKSLISDIEESAAKMGKK